MTTAHISKNQYAKKRLIANRTACVKRSGRVVSMCGGASSVDA